MLNSKQRAALRGEANSYDVVVTVGKSGIADALVSQVDGVLRTRELIKGKVLENSPLSSREAADQLAAQTGSEVVQVIGRCFVLYRANPEEPVVSEKLFGVKKRTPVKRVTAAPLKKKVYAKPAESKLPAARKAALRKPAGRKPR